MNAKYLQSKHQVLGLWMEYQLLCVQRGFQVLTLGAGTRPPPPGAGQTRCVITGTARTKSCAPLKTHSQIGVHFR